MMREPFHVYHSRRQLERDTAMPTLDAPAVTVRLRRQRHAQRLPTLTLGLAAILATLVERLAA